MLVCCRNPGELHTGRLSTLVAVTCMVNVTPLVMRTCLFSDTSRFQLFLPRKYTICPNSPGVVGTSRYAGFARPSGPMNLGSIHNRLKPGPGLIWIAF